MFGKKKKDNKGNGKNLSFFINTPNTAPTVNDIVNNLNLYKIIAVFVNITKKDNDVEHSEVVITYRHKNSNNSEQFTAMGKMQDREIAQKLYGYIKDSKQQAYFSCLKNVQDVQKNNNQTSTTPVVSSCLIQ